MTLKQYQRIVEVRDARRGILTDKQLAHELGLMLYPVRRAMALGIKSYDHQLSDGHGRKSET
jgi:hypothetical protein